MTTMAMLVALWAGAEGPTASFLPEEAKALRPLAKSPLGQAFLDAALAAPAYAPRTIYRKPKTRSYLSAADYVKLDAEARKAWEATPVAEATYQGLYYGTPLAYLPALELWAAKGGPAGDLRGKKILDFGHGGIGHLRLLAELGAEVVGVDIDDLQSILYTAAAGDLGPVGKRGGSVRLVHGKFPADPGIATAVGTGYDLFLSKNTLKNGYLHPAQPVDPRVRVDVGADDPTFLRAMRATLKPGGHAVIFNLTTALTPPGPKYSPQTDGRCPFSAADLRAAEFETILRDDNQDAPVRALGKALGWFGAQTGIKAETDLFALATILRKQ